MVDESTRRAWQQLGYGLSDIFQNWGMQRARNAEFQAQMAMDELRRKDAKEAADSLHEIRLRTLELDEERAKREKEQVEYDRETETEMEEMRRTAATAYTRLYTPQQMPAGPSERYRSPTSPPPGSPRGVGTPRFEEPSDIVGFLKNMGMSDEVIQSVLSGAQGPLPITQPPRELTPKEQADLIKTLAETEHEEAQTYRILNPLPRATGGGGATIDLSKIFGDLITQQAPPPEIEVDLERLSAGIKVALEQGIARDALETDLVENYGYSDEDAKKLLDEIIASGS